jgi:hypothetical protein
MLLPVRGPLVPIRGHRAHHARLTRKIQTTELAVLLHRLVPLFLEDYLPLVVHLMRRSEPFSGRLDLRSPTYPHVHR